MSVAFFSHAALAGRFILCHDHYLHDICIPIIESGGEKVKLRL